jgi:hypothetical protein
MNGGVAMMMAAFPRALSPRLGRRSVPSHHEMVRDLPCDDRQHLLWPVFARDERCDASQRLLLF